MSLSKSKKGIDESAGFGIVLLVVLLLLFGGASLAVVKHTASKFDEKKQVWLCTILNEIKFGIRKASDDVLTSGESICSTIDKHTNEKTFVPTSNYKQSKEGAELEIRDMLKNCWDMWLKGSQPNTFRGYPFSVPCFTCYTFKIEEKINGVTYASISKSMEEPLFAKDLSNGCMDGGGGYWRLNKCNLDEGAKLSKKTPPEAPHGEEYKCCAKDLRNECENRGGKCSPTNLGEEYSIYKWKCIDRGNSCYVKEGNVYSYADYIRKGERGGEIFFKPSGNTQASDINYVPGEIYTISFFSPNKQLCTSTGCILLIGGYGIGALGLTAAAGYGLVAVGPAAASAVGSFTTKLTTFIGLNGVLVGGVAAAGVYRFGILNNLIDKTINFAVKPISNEVPNFIIVSTMKDAKELGCTMRYSN